MKNKSRLTDLGGFSSLSRLGVVGVLPIAAAICLGHPLLTALPTELLPSSPLWVSRDRPADSSQTLAQWRRVLAQGTVKNSQRKPGGTRGGECVAWNEDQFPMALIPEVGPLLTIAERPTVWLYLPYVAPSVVNFKLELRDMESQTKIEKPLTYSLNRSPGIVRLKLPALEANKSYKWSFLEVCEKDGVSKEQLLFHGYIERLTVAQSLPPLPEGLNEYRSQGLWLDAFNGIAELRLNNREQSLWTQLLEEVDLGEIAPASFAPTVDPQ
ncbi:DUF928 domain-containing protein [Trichothermofontia sp.]